MTDESPRSPASIASTPKMQQPNNNYSTEMTEPPTKKTKRAGKQFASRVPQTLLQQALSEATNAPPDAELSHKIKAALIKKLHGYTIEQCSIVVKNMTQLQVAPNTVVVPEGTHHSSLIYVAEGTLKGGDGVHMIMTDTLFGDVFGGNCDADETVTVSHGGPSSITTQDACVLWEISRLLFQAVLIQHTKENDAIRSSIVPSIPILAPLSQQQQQQVASVMQRVEFVQGTKIIEQGKVGNTMYFIEAGEVTINKISRGEAGEKTL